MMKHTNRHFSLFLLCAFLSMSALAQRASRQALKAFELGEFAQAAEDYEKLVRKSPEKLDERARFAYALRMLGRLEEAETEYAALGDIDNPDYSYQHALVLTELGRYPEAVEKLRRAAAVNHPNAAALGSRLQYAQAHKGQGSAWKVSNEFANTSGDEFGVETVGDFVVFASERDAKSPQLYKSVRDNNNFLRVPNKLHRVSTDQAGDAPVAYSPSGQLIAYTRNNFTPGERFLPETGWELSMMLTTPTSEDDFLPGKAFVHNGNGYNTGFASFSPDGTRIYFASDRPGGHGGYDLYYSDRESDNWGPPVNLGPVVNTPGNEIAPQTVSGSLYFSSDYLPGFGGMDIYRADLVEKEIATVVNLGDAVNSPLDDVGFALSKDGQFAYFASNRKGGKGGMDIYRAVRAGTAVTLAVIDGQTRKPIQNAVLDFSDCGQGVFLTGVDGAYTFRAMPALNCRPVVKKSGFNTKQFSIVAATLRENQRVEIILNQEDKLTIYEGRVIHSRTGNAIANASIFARQIDGDFSAEAITDAKGQYQLQLMRAQQYTIEYAAPSMATIDREVSTFDTDGANILSSFAMFPDPKYDDLSAATTNSINPDSVPSEAVPMRNKPSGKTDDAIRTVKGMVSPGISVQVAAVSMNGNDIQEYQRKLRDVGITYGKLEGNLMRVRVGTFSDREDAVKAQALIRTLGFADAFITQEEGGEVIGLDRKEELNPTSPEPRPKSSVKSGIVWNSDQYFVRLATFSSLINFDQAKASTLGVLTTRKSGDYVIVLLQGFATAGDARDKMLQAQQSGYPDAQVVQEQPDGTLKIVR